MQFKTSESLPIDSFLNGIFWDESATKIIVAEPGAGKTTHLPAFLATKSMKSWWVVEPRRWAAKESARRIAEEQGWKLGDEVGFQVRLESRFHSETKLLFQTEGIFLNRLLKDPSLENVEGIILDEFHERSSNLDLAAMVLKQIQQSLRPDLKIIILSATLDSEKLAKYYDASVIQVPGRVFPVKFVYEECDSRPEAWAKKIIQYQAKDLDTLVFLPGAGEIERVSQDLNRLSSGPRENVYKLYSRLDERSQKIVFDTKRPPGIVLSTNIAETSLTLPKVGVVIDTGLAKQSRYEPATGLNRLALTKISAASAKQRAGRAGRVREGLAVRLWSESEQLQKRHYETPEILRTDLSQVLLWLLAWGETNSAEQNWLDAPAPQRLQEAFEKLKLKGFASGRIDAAQITEDGKRVLELSVDPNLARLWIEAEKEYCVPWAAKVMAWMESADQDIHSLEELDREIRNLRGEGLELSKNWTRKSTQASEIEPNQELKLKCLVRAFPEKVFYQGKSAQGAKVLVDAECGIGFRVQQGSGNQGARVFSFIPVEPAALKKYLAEKIQENTHLELDSENGRVRAFRGKALGNLPIETQTEIAVDPVLAGEFFRRVLNRDEVLQKNLPQTLLRLSWYSRHVDSADLDLEFLKQKIWGQVTEGKKTIADIEQACKEFTCSAILEYGQFSDFEKQVPTAIEVPSGSQIALEYLDHQIRCAVRLQEVFGWLETPKVLKNRIPITLELLSPSFKPVQTTQDLNSFWKGAYHEVRKELRARYPRHSWPDDPFTAQAVSKGGRRKAHPVR